MNAEAQKINFGLPISDWSKLPHGPEWSTKKLPGHFVIRTRIVRLSTGETHRYIVQRRRPTSKRELLALENEITTLKREVYKMRFEQITATDRALLARKNAVNGIRKRRRKSR
jgi:hypothetical protein